MAIQTHEKGVGLINLSIHSPLPLRATVCGHRPDDAPVQLHNLPLPIRSRQHQHVEVQLGLAPLGGPAGRGEHHFAIALRDFGPLSGWRLCRNPYQALNAQQKNVG